jgi:hypothetical protein
MHVINYRNIFFTFFPHNEGFDFTGKKSFLSPSIKKTVDHSSDFFSNRKLNETQSFAEKPPPPSVKQTKIHCVYIFSDYGKNAFSCNGQHVFIR